jgi:flagellar motility protein MotE (MotC chaperone)
MDRKPARIIVFFTLTTLVSVFLLGGRGPAASEEASKGSMMPRSGGIGLYGGAESPEELLKVLNDRKLALDKREQDLRREEERLHAIQADVADSLKKNTELREEMKRLSTTGKKPEDKLDHLVKVYEVMSTEEAASRMEAMDQKLAIDLLSRMKGKTVAKIFANMTTGKATSLSAALAKH